MRNHLITAVCGVLVCMTGAAAHADNSTVENALKSRPDLSEFYRGLVNTGVIHELAPDVSYTVFAPTNAAFAGIPVDRYPCFYSQTCREEVAEILRHHIMAGQVYVDTVAQHQGGVYSINKRFVAISEPSRNDYTVDGHAVLTEFMLGEGVLYRINGVIANDYDLAKVETPKYTPVAAQTTTTTTTEKKVTDKVCPPGEDCPDTVSTTVTRTVTAPEGSPALGLAPSR